MNEAAITHTDRECGLRAVLDRAARFGPFFTIDRVDDADPGTPVRALYDPEDPLLDHLVARVRERLGGVEARVAASTTHLGYVSRLLSPALAVLLAHGSVAHLTADEVRIRQHADAFPRLGAGSFAGRLLRCGTVTGEETVARLTDALFCEHFTPLAAHMHRRYRLAPRLLAGNTASAAFGAVRMLPPSLHEDGFRLLEVLLARGPLAGTGRLGYHAGQPTFMRRSCCLYYRVPGGGACGDCPIAQPPRR